MLALLLGPVGLNVMAGELQMRSSVALASDPLAQPKISADECVPLGLLVLSGGDKCPDGKPGFSNNPATGGAIMGYLKAFLRLAGMVVGMVIFLMVVVSGVLYQTSLGDPARVKSAKDKLQNALIALVMYFSMFAILNFLVPGGLVAK